MKNVAISVLALFLLPVMARAALYGYEGGPRRWSDADWSSIGSLPPASAHPDARLLVLSGRTGGWKGVLATHSWIVIKPANATEWQRYDVVGWGMPVHVNGWAPDGRWFGNQPMVIADIKGNAAEALIPKIETAIKNYKYNHAGDYRLWPGPNSNTFVASVLRAVPEIGVALPTIAIGRDFRPGPYAGLSDSGTGVEASLWGALGVKLGWVEGFELNVLGLVAGVDMRNPGLKLPGFGHVGIGGLSAAAAPNP
jgi:Protein of unknown function (DUF3750)